MTSLQQQLMRDLVADSRLPWMLAADLPASYSATHQRPSWVAEMADGGPVILRGAREMMYRTPERRANMAAKFVRRAIYFYRVSVPRHPEPVPTSETKKLDAIAAAAFKRWPMCRSIHLYTSVDRRAGGYIENGIRRFDFEAAKIASDFESRSVADVSHRHRLCRSIAATMREIRRLDGA